MSIFCLGSGLQSIKYPTRYFHCNNRSNCLNFNVRCHFDAQQEDLPQRRDSQNSDAFQEGVGRLGEKIRTDYPFARHAFFEVGRHYGDHEERSRQFTLRYGIKFACRKFFLCFMLFSYIVFYVCFLFIVYCRCGYGLTYKRSSG